MSALSAAAPTGGIGGLLHEAAALCMAAVGVGLVLVAKGWNFPGARGRIKFQLGWHGRWIAYSLAAIIFGVAVPVHFVPRLVVDAERAWPGVIAGTGAIAIGAVSLTRWASRRRRRRVGAGAAAVVALALLGSVTGDLLDALGSGARATGATLGHATAATAHALPWVLGTVALLGIAGLLSYWMVDRAASKDQRFKRAGIFVLSMTVLLAVLLLTGVVTPEQLFARNGGQQ